MFNNGIVDCISYACQMMSQKRRLTAMTGYVCQYGIRFTEYSVHIAIVLLYFITQTLC